MTSIVEPDRAAPARSPGARVLDAAARAGGGTLLAATAAIGGLRPATRPLHPRGEVRCAELVRHGRAGRASGIPWLDGPGTSPALVRLSAGIGLPRGWPDVHGIAVRVALDEPGQTHADLLLATTGSGRLTRYLLAPARSSLHRAHTTLLPYRGPRGPVILAALPVSRSRIVLSWASLTGDWVDFAELVLGASSAEHPTFDAVHHAPPGLRAYPWAAALRDPSYRHARRRRGEPADG